MIYTACRLPFINTRGTNLLGVLLPSCLVRRVRKVLEVVDFLRAAGGGAAVDGGVEPRLLGDRGRAGYDRSTGAPTVGVGLAWSRHLDGAYCRCDANINSRSVPVCPR